MKSLARKILGGGPVRAVTLFICGLLYNVGRLASYCRARALFPGSDLVCHWSSEIKCPQNITLGKRVIIGSQCTIGAVAPVYLGDDVLLSKNVFIDTGTADISTPVPYAKLSKPIRIEDGVWIGAGAMIMAGVTIGRNSIVAAGTIVRKSVPADSFVTSERPRVQPFRA
ncbi:MAG: acyltransferase [Brevundimonas sp.]|nr:MAG: acyltransferase [Brevundimonas sp.]